MSTITDKLRIGGEIRELKIGKSFRKLKNTNSSHGESFHTFRYDFKPASVDTTKIATMEYGENNSVTVTMPNVESSGLPQTVFKGSRRPNNKECVLVIDHTTGDVTLERLSNNVILKKTRAEGSSKAMLHKQLDSMTMETTPLPETSAPSMPSSLSSLTASLNEKPPVNPVPILPSMPIVNAKHDDDMVGILSESSSDSSDRESSSSDNESSDDDAEDAVNVTPKLPTPVTVKSGPKTAITAAELSSPGELSESDSESEWEEANPEPAKKNNSNSVPLLSMPSMPSSLTAPPPPSMPSMPKFSQLSRDLQLSESGSDSD